MPSLNDLKLRIKSVKSTQKITKAMKMVAAAKLRRAREAAENARPYAVRMEQMVTSLAVSVADPANAPKLLVGTGREQTHLIIVATADRGLCGAFNSSIARSARATIRELIASGKKVKILTVGKKGRDLLRTEFGHLIVDKIEGIGKGKLSYDKAEQIAEKVLALFEAGEFDVARVIYNHFKSPIVQIVTHQQIIPLSLPANQNQAAGGAGHEYEPDEETILADLLPRNVAVQLFKSFLENAASEQGARMSAMDSATRNAGEMIGKLTLKYNRTRQATITKQLIEIISGAEAV